MRRRVGLIIILISLLALSSWGCSTRHGVSPYIHTQTVLDVGFFYDELSPYGRWLSVSEFGWVWTPYGVPYGWRPYTDGYWVWTDYGWTWMSVWRWGWAPFHYGRWHHHHQHGWVWVPGTVWSPAWVAWRHGPGWIGWAPLPPHSGWRSGFGVSIDRAEIDRSIQPDWYSFVENRQFASREMNRHIIGGERNGELILRTQNVTSYTTTGNRVVNRGIDVDRFEQETQQKVPHHRLVDRSVPGSDADAEQVRNDSVRMYRPEIQDKAVTRVPRNIEAAQTGSKDLQLQQEKLQRKVELKQAEEKARLEKSQRKLEQQRANEKARLERQQTKQAQRVEQDRVSRERRQQKQVQRERQRQENKASRKRPPN